LNEATARVPNPAPKQSLYAYFHQSGTFNVFTSDIGVISAQIHHFVVSEQKMNPASGSQCLAFQLVHEPQALGYAQSPVEKIAGKNQSFLHRNSSSACLSITPAPCSMVFNALKFPSISDKTNALRGSRRASSGGGSIERSNGKEK
jgi:hypothetical protein